MYIFKSTSTSNPNRCGFFSEKKMTPKQELSDLNENLNLSTYSLINELFAEFVIVRKPCRNIFYSVSPEFFDIYRAYYFSN